MQAATTRLDVARRHDAAPIDEAHVARERGEPGSARDGKIESPEHGLALRRRLGTRFEPLHEPHELDFRLATQHRVGNVGEQIRGVEQGVQPVKYDPAGGIHAADPLRRPDAKAKRGVHRHGDRDEPRLPQRGFIEGFDREVDGCRDIARPLEEGLRPGQPQRLVAELVAGHEEDRAWCAQDARRRFPGGGVQHA